MPAQVGVVATGRLSPTHDFSVAVDVVRFYEPQCRIRWNCSIQIDNRVMVPNNRTADEGKITRERLPDDLFIGVDRVRNAEAVALQGSEVADLSIFPTCGMERRIVRRACAPYCYTKLRPAIGSRD